MVASLVWWVLLVSLMFCGWFLYIPIFYLLTPEEDRGKWFKRRLGVADMLIVIMMAACLLLVH